MKLGIIVDSSCGLTKQEAEAKGWIYLPLFMTIDNKEYADGVDITPDEYYEIINVEMNVRTSATPPGIIEDIFKKASKKYDHIIVYPLSKELSSQTNNLKMIANNFNNIHVLSSKGVGYAIVLNCEEIEEYAKKENSWETIIKKAEKLTDSQKGFVIPKTMDWLVKGGRASKSVASIANMLKIVPIISFENGLLGKGGKGRIFKKTFLKAAKDLFEKEKSEKTSYIMLSAKNESDIELKKTLKENLGIEVEIKHIPPVIGNHIGKGALAFLAIKSNL